MTVSSMVTSGPGDATTFVSQMDLDAVDVLLFVGGDGTVYEGLQVRASLMGQRLRIKARTHPVFVMARGMQSKSKRHASVSKLYRSLYRPSVLHMTAAA
jgi:hypothetical protein